MELMQNWKNSLQLLHPNQLKPFLMVTAKTVMSVYATLNKPLSSRGNWELAGVVLLLIVTSNFIQAWYLFAVQGFILNVVRYALFFVFALGMRPSVAPKDQAYFIEYSKRFKYLLLAMVLLGSIPIPGYFTIFAFPFIFQWWMFFLFFAFDSAGSLRDIMRAKKQAVKLFFYNLPICIVLEIVLRIFGYIILQQFVGWAIGWGGLTLAIIAYLLVIPVEVALLCNFYIKKFHDQPDAYLNQHVG